MAGNQDYVEFLSEFVNGLNIPDQLPVPVSSYNIDDDELVGDFVHWLLQYFGQKHCPLGLVAPLARAVVEEMLNFCKTDPEAHSLRDPSGQYSQLRLMQACTSRANALCTRLHLDPSVLLPPPPSHLVPVAAQGARSNQRRGMEDRHVVVHDFNAVFNVQDDTPASYFAVFDGHAGQDAAVFSAAHVHQFLAESIHYPADPVAALKDAILRTDKYYLKKVKYESRYQSGTTALCSLLRGRMLHIAWVGDSQAVLVRNGRAEMMVDPHKPKRPDEERRITELGGVVLFHGMWRVNGQLAVSRAIGDPNFKPYVSAEAEVRTLALEGDEELLIMASDGLLDFVTPQQAASAAFQQLRENPDNINAVCSRLINLAKKQGSTDDISVIVVFLTDPHELAKRPIPPDMDMDTEDLVDTTPNHHNNMNGSNNQWSNPFQQESAAKKAINLDDLNFEPTPLKQNGSGENGAGFNHQDLFDMGPETDVDHIDESDDDDAGSQDGAGSHNPFACGVDDEEVELRRIQQQQPEFDIARHPREETPTPPADHVPESDQLVLPDNVPVDDENVADSGDESEEEWKYFSVEPSKQAPQSFELLQNQSGSAPESKPEEETVSAEVAPQLTQESQPETEVVDENMDSQLNPNAAEFVPVSPTRESCVLPGDNLDPFHVSLTSAATESEPVFQPQPDFEHNPIDFLSSAQMEGDKENLVFGAPPTGDMFGQTPMFGDNIEQENTNYMDFCGTLPPKASESSLFTQQENPFDDAEFEQKFDEGVPMPPAQLPISPIKSDPEENMFSQDLAPEERLDMLVETPNFSVAQGPAFPVVENIVTPDEDSASANSPVNEENPFASQLKDQAPISPVPVSPMPEEVPAPESPTQSAPQMQEVDFLAPSLPMQEAPSPVSPLEENLPSSPIQDFTQTPVPDELPPAVSPIAEEMPEAVEDKFSPVMSPIAEQVAGVVCEELPPVASPLHDNVPSVVSPMDDNLLVHEKLSPSAPPQEDLLQDLLPPLSPHAGVQQHPEPIHLSEEPILDTTATPPPTPAMNTETCDKPVQEVEALSQVIEKLSIEAQPEHEIIEEAKMEPQVEAEVVKEPEVKELEVEEQKETKVEAAIVPEVLVEPEVKTETVPLVESKPENKEVESHTPEVVAGVVAVAAGAVAAVAAAKTSKPASPTKAEAKKPMSPTKEKPGVASKKAAVPSKTTPAKPTATKAPVPAKTTTTPAKPTATRSAPVPKPAPSNVAKKPAATASATSTAKPKPAVPSSTRAPKPSGVTSPSKPTTAAPRPKPAPSTKPAEAKKPLMNGDASKTAPKRPISATTNAKPAPRTAAPKPASPAKPAVTSTATKASPRPRPASAAVNGVSKPTSAPTKTATSRPASATASSTLAAKRTTTASKAPTTTTTTKQVKETANKQISATRTTTSKTGPPSRTSAAAAKQPVSLGKNAPIRKPTSSVPKTATKATTKDSPAKVDENVIQETNHVNGDSHPPNGKIDVEEQALLLDTPLVPLDVGTTE